MFKTDINSLRSYDAQEKKLRLRQNTDFIEITWQDFAQLIESTGKFWRPCSKKRCENCDYFQKFDCLCCNNQCNYWQDTDIDINGYCSNFRPKKSDECQDENETTNGYWYEQYHESKSELMVGEE